MQVTFEDKDRLNSKSESGKLKYWEDSLIQQFYVDYYNDLSSKELDQEFRKDLKALTKALSKLPDPERKAFINNMLSNYIEFYISQKVEKELDASFMKIFKLL